MPALSDRLRALLPGRFRKRRPRVAVVRLSGTIGAASPLRQGLSIEGVAGSLERAFALPGVKAVALIINSPGGSPAQSHLIFRRIRALAQEKDLPVVAFVEDVAASGGYMIACAADEIVADPTSIVGSIGVVSAASSRSSVSSGGSTRSARPRGCSTRSARRTRPISSG